MERYIGYMDFLMITGYDSVWLNNIGLCVGVGVSYLNLDTIHKLSENELFCAVFQNEDCRRACTQIKLRSEHGPCRCITFSAFENFSCILVKKCFKRCPAELYAFFLEKFCRLQTINNVLVWIVISRHSLE